MPSLAKKEGGHVETASDGSPPAPPTPVDAVEIQPAPITVAPRLPFGGHSVLEQRTITAPECWD